ncbi:hypothetical protein FB639_002005, partial [Coemansia asiatica]
WSNNQLTAEVAELRAEIAELHASLIKERQTHLETVAENDRLRIREHELDRRVRVLANISTRYYKEQEAAVTADAYERQEAGLTPSTDRSVRPHKRQRSLGMPHDEDEMSASDFACKELEIENETLQLSIETMRIQLQEQKANYAEIIEGLTAELKSSRDAAAREAADRTRKVENLETELSRIKGLYRENLRDLVIARKSALESKHSVKQDSLLLRSEILTLQRRLDAEMERSRFLQSSSTRAEDFSL